MSNLAKRSNVSSQIVRASRQHSATVTAQMVERAAARTSKELTQGENEDWVELLEREPGPAIRWAFMEHAKLSEFFPKPSEILGLIRTWRSGQAAEKAEEQRREEKADIERRLAGGEKLYGLADVIAEMRRVLDARPDLPAERKQELKQRVEDLQKGKRKTA